MRGKRGNAMPIVVIVLLAIIAVGVFTGGASSMLNSIGSKASDEGSGALCTSETSPSLTFKAYDNDNKGTALTESTNLYRKVGDVSWTSFTQGTAITTLDAGDKIEYVFGISTTDQTDNAYGPTGTYEVPCSENPSEEFALYQDEIETELSATFYNADGDAGAETFTANQEQTVSLKLTTGSDQYFGNPNIADFGGVGSEGQRAAYPNVVCFDLNSTAWDRPMHVKFDGVEMKSVATPQRHSTPSGDNSYCYEAPVIDDSVMENDRYQIRLDSDDSTAPAVDDAASIYAANFYINADSGDVEWGVEDEDGNAAGTDAADTVTLDFTA